MAAKHVTDEDIRRRLGAPHFQQLLDREVLRWAGHCARMSASRLPLQLLMGEVPAWPAREYGQPQARDRGKHRRSITQALRRYGIEDDVFLNAAQDAERWRARLRRGWRLRRDGSESGDSDGGEAPVEGGACAEAADGWPSRTTVVLSRTRANQDLVCPHCGYRTGFAGWLDTHIRRLHPGEACPL